MNTTIAVRKSTLSSLTYAVERLSPMGVLRRGYAVAERADNGKIIRSGSDIEVGQHARIRLYHDKLLARIDGKDTDEDP